MHFFRARPALSASRVPPIAICFAVLITLAANCSVTLSQPPVASQKIRSTVRAAKLLWKFSGKSAAKTLGDTIDQAIQRDQLEAIEGPLSELSPLANALVQQAQTGQVSGSDPRLPTALALKFLAGDEDAWAVAKTLLSKVEQNEGKALVYRVAIAKQPLPSLEYAGEILAASKPGEDQSWVSVVVRESIAAQPQAASELVLEHWSNLSLSAQAATIEPMTMSADSMLLLVQSVEKGNVAKSLINMNQLRKWASVPGKRGERIQSTIKQTWGAVRLDANAQREKLVAATLKKIQSGAAGSEKSGAAVFQRLCSQCHRLNNAGFAVGPDITGNGRGNLPQLVSNVLDPSLVIGDAFQAVSLLTVEGNVASGIMVGETDDFVKVKLQGGKTAEYARDDIEEMQTSKQSLMPEGLELQTTPQELLDLFAFLSIVRLPSGEEQLIPGVPAGFVQP